MNEQELQLQRLVDGQLDLKQTQEMLRSAEQEPEFWREMAVAFVEDQIWRNEITADAMAELVDQKEQPESTSIPKSDSTPAPGIKFWLALAAAIVLGIWLGRVWAPQDTNNVGNTNSIASHNNSPNSNLPQDDTSNLPERQLVNFEPAHHLSMGDAGEVPLYTLEQAQQMGLLKEQSLPQDTVNQLRERGYQLEQNTQYISGRAQDGRRILVPVRSVRFNPGN